MTDTSGLIGFHEKNHNGLQDLMCILIGEFTVRENLYYACNLRQSECTSEFYNNQRARSNERSDESKSKYPEGGGT